MAISFNYPRFKADNSDGTPMVGGLLYTYITGTTTAKATYSDNALTSANANPVVLNQYGEALVYLDTGTYKFILKTANSTTIWTQDNINAGSAASKKYYIDASATDQGAATAGGSSTVKDFVDAIGATEKATLVFVHDGVGNTTTYTFSTDEVVSSNFYYEIEYGAILAIDNLITLTTYSAANIMAGVSQNIFSGTGTKAFTAQIGVAYPEWWVDNATPGTTDMATGFNNALAANKKVKALGAAYLIGSKVTMGLTGNYLDGNGWGNTVITLSGATSYFQYDGTQCTIDNVKIDANASSNYCVLITDEVNRGQVKNSLLTGAEVTNFYIGEECTGWKLIDSVSTKAGDRDADGTPLTADAISVHAKGPGSIVNSNIGGATGRGLVVTGVAAEEEVRVDFIGGRINFCFKELLYVDGTNTTNKVSVHLNGTYLENPQLAEVGATGTGINTTLAQAILAEGTDAYLTLSQLKKFQSRAVDYSVNALDGARVVFHGDWPMLEVDIGAAQTTIAKTSATATTDEPGFIDFDIPDIQSAFETQWLGLAYLYPATNGLSILPREAKLLEVIYDGSTTTGLTATRSTAAVDSGTYLTAASSIKLTGDGGSAATNYFRDTWTPPLLDEQYIMIVAVMKTEQAGAGYVANTCLQVAGAGIFPATKIGQQVEEAAPGAGSATEWRYHALFFKITDDAQTIDITCYLDNSASISDDILYVDSISAYAIKSRKPIMKNYKTIQTYTETNVTPDRSFDADTAVAAEIADVLGTLIVDLRAQGIVK